MPKSVTTLPASPVLEPTRPGTAPALSLDMTNANSHFVVVGFDAELGRTAVELIWASSALQAESRSSLGLARAVGGYAAETEAKCQRDYFEILALTEMVS